MAEDRSFWWLTSSGNTLASPRRRRHIRHMVMRDVSADMLLGKLRARIEEYGAAIKSFHYEEPQFDGTADDGVIVFLSAKITEFDSAIAKLGKNDDPNSGEAD
jgi:hypothetical protein